MSHDSPSPHSPVASNRGEPPTPAIPDFDMVRRIGQGSYGDVWLARDLMGDYRAVKVVHRSRFAEDRPYDREYDGIRRFGRVSQSHPSQLQVLHVGRGEGFFYYAMELADDASEPATVGPAVEGGGGSGEGPSPRDRAIDPRTYRPKTLRSLMRPGRDAAGGAAEGLRALPVDQCVETAVALASALDDLHGKGLVHRDVKPSNIVFVHGRPKLADIGLVAGTDEERSVVGTEGYMAPQGPGGVQADLFALGRVLYEMITGFETKRFPELPDDWATRPDRKDLQALNQVVQWACEARPDRRYKSARAMLSDLELLRTHSSLVYRKLQRAARVLSLLSVVLTLLVFTTFFVIQSTRKRAAEERRNAIVAQVQSSSRRPVSSLNAGWFVDAWRRLAEANTIRSGPDVDELASALLTGLDAHEVMVRTNTSAVSAAFSARGECVVAGAGPDPVTLSIGAQGEITKLPALGEGPVGWTSEGAPIQLVSRSDRLILYELRTGRVLWEVPLTLHEAVVVLAMTPEGGRVAAALTNRVLVWETAAGGSPGEIEAQATALAFSPDGALLATGDANGLTRVYGVSGLSPMAALHSPSGRSRIVCLAFGRDPVVRLERERPAIPWVLATGERGGGIVVWDLNHCQPRSFCRGSTWTVWALAFQADGLTLASAGKGHVRLWDVAAGEVLLALGMGGFGEPLTVAVDPAGRRIVSGGRPSKSTAPEGPKVGLWELERHRGIEGLRGLSSAARKVWFSRNSQRLAALSDDWRLAVWDLARRRVLFVFETQEGLHADNAGGCFDADGGRFAFAAGREGRCFDLANGTVLRRWKLNDGLSDQIEVDDRGRLLLLRRERSLEVAGGTNWMWRLYELGESAEPSILWKQLETNRSVAELLFRPRGEHFVVGYRGPKNTNRVVDVFDAKDGRRVWEGRTRVYEDNLRMCVDPRGRWFGYTLGGPEGLAIVDLDRFEQIDARKDGAEAIHPAGREFARWGAGYYELAGPRAARAIPLRTDRTALGWVSAFSPDGGLFAWGTQEGVVMVACLEDVKRRLNELCGWDNDGAE